MHLSIVIPAYNEERRIIKTLSRVYAYIGKTGIDGEIIVVDDGSTDKTSSLVRAFIKEHDRTRLIANPVNRGKGFSVKNGMLTAGGDYILFTDADNSTPIQELNKMLPYLEEGEADVLIGSRSLDESVIKIGQSRIRSAMGKVFNYFVRSFLYKDFIDTQCGFKCFTRKAARAIFEIQRFSGFSFDIEVLYIAKKKGYRIKEIPVTWVNSLKSSVNPITDALFMLADIFRLKYCMLRDRCEKG